LEEVVEAEPTLRDRRQILQALEPRPVSVAGQAATVVSTTLLEVAETEATPRVRGAAVVAVVLRPTPGSYLMEAMEGKGIMAAVGVALETRTTMAVMEVLGEAAAAGGSASLIALATRSTWARLTQAMGGLVEGVEELVAAILLTLVLGDALVAMAAAGLRAVAAQHWEE
jgi:hypothetical protein